MSGLNTFKKNERLKSKKAIEALLKTGQKKNFFPIKVFVGKSGFQDVPLKFLVMVPKRKIASAVERNRVKRVLRELWRLHKSVLSVHINQKSACFHVAFLYQSDVLPDFQTLKRKMPSVLNYILCAIQEQQ